MNYVIVVVVFIVTTLVQAQPLPSTENTLDPVNGVAMIAWENDVQADTIMALLARHDCRGPTLVAIKDSGDPQQGIVQVPAGPPFDPPCLLRPGDRVYLQRWRDGEYIDTIGPYSVPIRVWLPMIMQTP